MTFDDCKDQIARESGFESFEHMDDKLEWAEMVLTEEFYIKAAHLYATEMIKADREQIAEVDLVHEWRTHEFRADIIRNLPINLS